MSQTSGLIPISSTSAAKKSSNKSDFDFEIDDDDLEDLLGLDMESDFKKKTTAAAAPLTVKGSNYKASSESLSSKSGGFNRSLFEDPKVPSSRTSFPKAQTTSEGPRFSTGSSRFNPDPILTDLKPKSENVTEKDMGAVLSKLGDMDDMGSGLFSSTGLVTKKASSTTTTANTTTKESGLFGSNNAYKDPFAYKNARPISPAKDVDTWSSSISNENSTNAPTIGKQISYLGNLPPAQTKGPFDKPISPGRGHQQHHDTGGNGGDDLLESMGLFGDSPKKLNPTKNLVENDTFGAISSLQKTSFNTTTNLKSNLFNDDSNSARAHQNRGEAVNFKSGLSDSDKDGFSRTSLFSTTKPDNPRAASPTSIKSKEEDFIPSFLAEASASRRRRGPAPGDSPVRSSSIEQKKEDRDFWPRKDQPQEAPSSKQQNNDMDAISSRKKNPLISSVSSQLSRHSKPLASNETAASGVAVLPFLDPKPQSMELKKPAFASADTSTLPKKAEPQIPIQKKGTLSKSSSLSSLVSLSPTDDDSSDNENLSSLKDKFKKNEIAIKPVEQVASLESTTKAAEVVSGSASTKTTSTIHSVRASRELSQSLKESQTRLSGDHVDPIKISDGPSKTVSEPRTEPHSQLVETHAVDADEKIKKLMEDLEERGALLKSTERRLQEAEAQISIEKAIVSSLEQLKQTLTEDHEKQIVLLKQTHSIALENAIKLEKQLIAESTKLELLKQKAEFEKAIAQLKSHHFDEMAKLISTADAAQQLESLSNKMQESSQLVDAMHHKLETDHTYSIKEREMALQLKERQLVELQRQIMKQNQNLEDERQKLKTKSDTTDALIEEIKREREDSQRIVDEEKRNLENQISIVRTERDLIQRQLHRERLEFVRQKETWTMERKKALLQSSDELKSLAMEKALLDAKRDAVVEVELEMERLKGREEAQIHAERLILDREAHAIAIKTSDLHREVAELRAEKIALESEKQKLASEKDAFEKGWQSAESRVKLAKEVHSSAENERKRAAELEAEVKNTLRAIEDQRKNLEESKKSLEAERLLLTKTKQKIIDDRIQLAHERTTRATESENHFTNIQRPVLATTQRLLQTVDTGIQNASSRTSLPKKNVGVLPRTSSITGQQTSHQTKQIPNSLFEAAKIHREIEAAQKAKKIAMTLKRYSTDLKENKTLDLS